MLTDAELDFVKNRSRSEADYLEIVRLLACQRLVADEVSSRPDLIQAVVVADQQGQVIARGGRFFFEHKIADAGPIPDSLQTLISRMLADDVDQSVQRQPISIEHKNYMLEMQRVEIVAASESVCLFRLRRGTDVLADAQRIRTQVHFLRQAISRLPDSSVLIFDRDLRYTLAVGQTFKRIGMASDTIEGHSIYECWPEDVIPEIKGVYERTLAGESLNFETTFEDRFVYSIQTLPLSYEGSEVSHGMVIIHEITRDRALQSELEQKERMYRLLAENSDDLIVLLGKDGRLIYANPAHETLLGYSAEELPTISMDELIDPADIPRIKLLYGQLIQMQQPESSLEFRVRVRSGETLWLETGPKLIPHKPDDEIIAMMVSRNITDRKHAEQALAESEKRFKNAFDHSPIGMALVGLQGQFLQVNNRLVQILGYSREELLKLDFQTITYAPDVAEGVTNMGRLLRDEIARYVVEKRYVHKAGHVVWVRLVSSLMRNEAGQPDYFIAQFEDTTELKQTEESLSDLRRRMDLAQRLTRIATWDWDVRAKTLRFDQHWIEFMGFEIQGQAVDVDYWDEFVHPDDAEKMSVQIQGFMNGQTDNYQSEYRLKRKGAGWVWIIDNSIATERDADGRLTRAIGISMDVTELKDAQDQIRNLVLERDRRRLLSNFIENSAHEFRTPLSVIQTSLHIMNQTDAPEVRRERSERISAQVNHITRLVDMLSLQVRLNSDLPLEKGTYDLSRMLDEVVNTLGGSWLGHDVQIAVEIGPHIPPIAGDAALLEEALCQMLGNAIRYAGPAGQVQVAVRRSNDQACIEISDNGKGISAENLAHIFDPFFRADSSHSTPGLGLGLSISQRIIELHGGHIEVESIPGDGSTFLIFLPLLV